GAERAQAVPCPGRTARRGSEPSARLLRTPRRRARGVAVTRHRGRYLPGARRRRLAPAARDVAERVGRRPPLPGPVPRRGSPPGAAHRLGRNRRRARERARLADPDADRPAVLPPPAGSLPRAPALDGMGRPGPDVVLPRLPPL